MSNIFPKSGAKVLGYEPGQVDAVVNQARVQFGEPNSSIIDARELRLAQFDLVEDGYLISEVDAALDRLDDAFALREKQRLFNQLGPIAAGERVDEIRRLLKGRVRRPKGKRLGRQNWFGKGYSVGEVDHLMSRVAATLQGKDAITVQELRDAAFKPKWGGYIENQVDSFIDKTIEYLQLSKLG